MEKITRDALINEIEKLLVNRVLMLEAHNKGDKAATKCFYRYRETWYQLTELKQLYKDKEITKDFYEKENQILTKKLDKILLGFDTSKIIALKYLKEKKGLPGGEISKAHEEILKVIQSMRKAGKRV